MARFPRPLRVRLRLDLPARRHRMRRVLPFRRTVIGILIVAGIAVAMTIPAVLSLSDALREWRNLDSLFDLVSVLFLAAWSLGWSMGPLILFTIFLMMAFGREVVRARPGNVEIFIGLPGIGFAAEYDAQRMRNLRLEQPTPGSGLSWRGPHLAFDYEGATVNFGSALGQKDLAELRAQLELATGTVIRNSTIGEAGPPVTREPVPPEPDSVPQPAGGTSWLSLSIVALIAANLVPVVGALEFGWDLGDVLLLYWAESAVIGFYTLCKMAVAQRWLVLFAGPFFLGHFGGFMSIHFLFLYGFFLGGFSATENAGDLAHVFGLFRDIWPALLALFVSHGMSFFTNFIGRREYAGRKLKEQMMEPYSRIIFMHLVLILGGGVTMALGDRQPVLLAVIVLKVIFDVRAHLKERRRGT